MCNRHQANSFQSLNAEPNPLADLPSSPNQFLQWLSDNPRPISELVCDILLSQKRKFCDYYIEPLHPDKRVDFILKINEILDSKFHSTADYSTYSLPSELFVGAMQSNYLTGEQIKSLSNKTYSIAHSRKREARKKYLESRAHNDIELESSTIIQSMVLEKENENISAAEFDRVFGKQEYN